MRTIRKFLVTALFVQFLGLAAQRASGEVLLVADEFPAMEVLASKLDKEEHVASKLVSPKDLPASLTAFTPVVVYIHGELAREAENAFIDYAQGGGKLVLLHHSISSGKRKNARWFSFLGVSLPEGELDQGGYKWIEPATFAVVNLNPNHFIVTNRISYPARVSYSSAHAPTNNDGYLPGFTLEASEVYLNHVLNGPRTLLLGLKYTDPKTKTVYQQETAGWIKPSGKGWIIYLMPGHRVKDFEDSTYARIVTNAVIFRP